MCGEVEIASHVGPDDFGRSCPGDPMLVEVTRHQLRSPILDMVVDLEERVLVHHRRNASSVLLPQDVEDVDVDNLAEAARPRQRFDSH